MSVIRRMNHTILLISAGLVVPGTAFAYLDPGTGSAIIQGLLAALAAIAVTAKLYWHRLLGMFGIRGRSSGNSSSSVESGERCESATTKGEDGE